MLSATRIAELIREGREGAKGGISVIPEPEAANLNAAASLDLRLGRWFLSIQLARTTSFNLARDDAETHREIRRAKRHFVPFDKSYVLHPGRFVLGATLEWLSLPTNVSGYVTGKSSLGRRGLIIETAAGIHPGFSGCLTLELANVGEVPLEIEPGMRICQIFFHETDGAVDAYKGRLSGRRRPTLGRIGDDPIKTRLSRPI